MSRQWGELKTGWAAKFPEEDDVCHGVSLSRSNQWCTAGFNTGSSPFYFISGLTNGAKCILRKIAEDTKMGGVADAPQDCAAMQRVQDRLEKWADMASWSSAAGSAKSCTWGGITPCTSGYRGLISWYAALQRRTWGSWWTSGWVWDSSVPLFIEGTCLGCITRYFVSRSREVMLSLYSALVLRLYL